MTWTYTRGRRRHWGARPMARLTRDVSSVAVQPQDRRPFPIRATPVRYTRRCEPSLTLSLMLRALCLRGIRPSSRTLQGLVSERICCVALADPSW